MCAERQVYARARKVGMQRSEEAAERAFYFIFLEAQMEFSVCRDARDVCAVRRKGILFGCCVAVVPL